MPTGSILMFDVPGLDRVAPSVLNAGAVAGVAGGIGPLLSRLGTALEHRGRERERAESIFHAETAVAIVPHQGAAHAGDRGPHPPGGPGPDRARLARGAAGPAVHRAQFRSRPGAGVQRPHVGGITDHQLSLANGLELDYGVFRGLVVISTSRRGWPPLPGAATPWPPTPATASRSAPARGSRRWSTPTSPVCWPTADQRTDHRARLQALGADLARITAIGLTSTRGTGFSDSQLSLRIP